jgi:ribonuclease T2
MYLLILLLMFSFIQCAMSADPSTMYVFAYSWTPGFCIGQTYPGCNAPQSYWKKNFTIHGLWPQYTTSGYPSTCTTEAFNSSITDSIGMDIMVEKWPDVQYDIDSSSYDSFWEHEWTKHGTCSGLSQHDYFTTALELTNLLITPELLHNSIGLNVSAAALRSSIADPTTVSLQCKNQQLMGVYTCWKQQNGIPTKLFTCPDDVLHEDSCKDTDLVYIPELLD